MVLFGIYFTSRWRIDARYPWIKWLLIAPLVAQTLFTMAMQTGMSESYRTVEPLVDTFSRRGPAGTVAGLLGIVLFFVAIGSKSRDPDNDKDARRRFRLLLWGSAVSLIPLSCLLVFLLIYGFRDNLWSAVPTMLTLLFPVTIAHVIVVHRAMDVRVAIRQGVQSRFRAKWRTRSAGHRVRGRRDPHYDPYRTSRDAPCGTPGRRQPRRGIGVLRPHNRAERG